MAPPLKVVDVYCEGNVNLKTEDIITAAHLETGKNILLSNIGRAKRAVGKLPLADEVTVHRVFPNRICISVKERIPAAYIMSGSHLAVLDVKGVVLEKIEDGRVNTVIQTNIPSLTPQSSEEENSGEKPDGISDSDGDRADNKTDADKTDENSGNSIDKDSESGENKSEEAADNNDGNAENGGGDTADIQNSGLNMYSVPLVAGVELSNAEAGKNAKCGDETKLQTVLDICGALEGAGLLNRATYIDVSDTADVRVMIENRLEVQFGAPDNMEYRAKFLSEIISAKISAYEKAVMDYRGNDIYVRQPDDGKLRVEPKRDTGKKNDENDENDENGDEETSENSDDEESDDSDGDSDTSGRESDDESDSRRSGTRVLDGGDEE